MSMGVLSYVIATFTSDWMTTTLIAGLFIGGALLFRFGRSKIIAPDSSPIPDQQTWLNRLEFWGALTLETEEHERQRLLRQLTIVQGYMIVGVSLGGIVTAILLAGLALALGGAGSLARPGADIINAISFPAMIIAPTLSYLFGTRMLSRNRPSDQPRGETRFLRDYCAPWVWALPVILTIMAVALLLRASFGAPDMTVEWFGKPVSISGQVAGGAEAALIMGETLIALVCARRIAASANALIAVDPVGSQRASDCLRSYIAGSLIFLLWLNCSFTLTNIDLLRSALGFPQVSGILGVLQDIIPAVGFLMYLVGIFPMVWLSITGRMGGRLTGWPRQRRPGLRERATAEGS